jgi:hypothetical protein
MARRKSGDYLSNVDDTLLECRTLGHNWEDVGDYLNGQQVHLVLQCQRCDSYAVVQWSRSAGTIDGRRYKYTEGYINKTGEKITKAEARVERIRRTSFTGGTKEFDALMNEIDREWESYR